MDRGWGGRPRRAVVALALTLLGLLVFSVPALGAGDPPPVPRPDPPPKANPPPPPPASGPPAPQQAAPVAPAPAAAPTVVHPTAAERRAAVARRAKRKAARARRIAAEKLAAAHRPEQAQASLVAASSTPSSSWGLPFVLVAFSAALLVLGLALTPARAVPWDRASRALEDRREELGVMGGMGLVATFVFFLLVQVTK